MTKAELNKAFEEARQHAISVTEMEIKHAQRQLEDLKTFTPKKDMFRHFMVGDCATYAMGTLRMITDIIQGKYK